MYKTMVNKEQGNSNCVFHIFSFINSPLFEGGQMPYYDKKFQIFKGSPKVYSWVQGLK